MARLPYSSIAPEGYRHLLGLAEYLGKSGLGAGLLNLVYLRASQMNGCPFCVDMHWREARQAGEDERKLNAVVVWRDTPFFDERERAALAWAETVTRLRDQRVSDEEYESVKLHFTEREVVDLTLAIANINAFNRMAIAFHVMPAARKTPAHSGAQ
jgi:AhpD family alkylhydroperoxidase